MGRDGVVVSVEGRAGHSHPALQADAHQRDLLAYVAGPGVQAADVVLVVLDRGQRDILGQPGESGVKAGVGVERDLVVAQVV